MSLTLVIETSSRAYAIGFSRKGGVVYKSIHDVANNSGRDLKPQVKAGLGGLGAAASDISKIAVNYGPGGLGAIRAGVAFANGLGFALNVPVAPLLSFELFAEEARARTDLPLLCLRKAAAGAAYAGLMRPDAEAVLRFGPLSSVTRLAADLPAVALAGSFRVEAAAQLADVETIDTGIDAPRIQTLATLAERHPGQDVRVEPVLPINEFSPRFPPMEAA
ncbi:MAG: tRNA (adenosine(37)-N6)-threonylcarbamoyltransferase complex dimerization subunit type 1 TsaB [Pseudomonadota bacterium]